MRRKLPNELVEGLCTPSFIEKEDGTEQYEFDIKLIRKLPSWNEPVPYPLIRYNGQSFINAQKEKWLVEIVNKNKFEDGTQLVRWVARFHSKNIIQIPDEAPSDI